MSFFRRPLVGPADRLAATGVALFTLVLFVLTFVGPAELSAAEVEFQSTSALVRTGRLALGGTPEAEAIRAAVLADPELADELHVRVVAAGAETEVYGRHGVGQVLLALPFYALGRLWALAAPELEAEGARQSYDDVPASESLAHLVVGLRNPLLGAGTVWLVAMCALRLGVGRRRAVLAALGLGLTTYLWPQARSSLSDVQATFCLALAFHLVLVARERLDRLEMPRGRIALGIGAALALAFLSRIAVAPACVLLAAVGETVLRLGFQRIQSSRWSPRGTGGVTPMRALVFGVAPLLVGFALFVGTNLARFGAPFDSGYGNVLAGSMFRGDALTGLAGLWLSPGRGLLVFAPLVLLVPFGLARAVEEGERLVITAILGVTVLITLPAVFAPEWHGDATYGPRYLLPALPFLWLFVALGLEEGERRKGVRRLGATLAVLGLVVTLPGVLVDHRTNDELTRAAARHAWPDAQSLGLPIAATEPELERERFERTLWDLRFAAPFTHWRIFRHRVAGLGEDFPVETIYFVPHSAVLTPAGERSREFRHFGWREFVRRFGGPAGVPVAVGALLLMLAVVALARGLDRTAQ
jgi:hypothetical protein